MNGTFFDTLGSCKIPPRKPLRTNPGNRPQFIFRFDDQWSFSRSTTPSLSASHDFRRVAFNGDFVALAKQIRRPLSPLEADFAWLALAVYLADRFSPRCPYGINGPGFWRRRIHLEIPVREPKAFKNASDALVHALEFLTEDDWSFEFVGGRNIFNAEGQEHLRELRGPRVQWTSLFSGGLDSMAGALRWLQHTDGVGLLVSGQTHNRIATGQQAQVAAIREHFPLRIEHVGVDYGVPDKHDLTGFESSQRTRAFIHTALGSLAALTSGCEQLFLFENGFGALNLACDAAQLGSQNSRGTHPVFLRRMAAFVSAAFSQSFSIVNPFTFLTKSQMLGAPGMLRFVNLFPLSFSCDRYPNYQHKASQCGHCASCLVRRLAFYSAGLADYGGNYSTDVFHLRRELRESELMAMTKLTIQAEALEKALRRRNVWPSLCATWPDLLRSELEIAHPSFREGAVALFHQHVAEWQSFSKNIHPAVQVLAA